MPTQSAIDDFLSQDHLAFVGVSSDAKQFPNTVYREMRDHGRTMYPVNRSAELEGTLEGDHAYRSLAEVPDPVDGVVVMVGADQAATVVREAIARGIPRVWLHRGIGRGSSSEEAVSLCRAEGIEVVDGACPLMFDEPVRGIHALHRSLSRRRLLKAG